MVDIEIMDVLLLNVLIVHKAEALRRKAVATAVDFPDITILVQAEFSLNFLALIYRPLFGSMSTAVLCVPCRLEAGQHLPTRLEAR